MLIQMENVNKIYRGVGYEVNALKDINLQIEEGEMVAIMGASGSGKSTLLNILGCLDRATDGKYFLDERDITTHTEKEMALLRNDMFGFILQDFALVERYTVEKNVMLPLYYSKVSRKDRVQKVDKILDEVDILEKKNQLALRLSGGQRQRVAIARALVNDAKIILCDEPTGALDQKTGQDIVDIFKRLNEAGKTIIIVTHDPKVASQCGRVIEIQDGRIA